MAITLEFETGYIQPVYNEIIFVASESDASELTEFEIVANVSVEGTPISTIKVQPNPSGYSIFDIHRILESELTFDFTPEDLNDTATMDTFQLNSDTLKYYNVEFYGEGRAGNSIAIADTGGFTRISTNIVHGLSPGDTITIIDSSVSGYNKTSTITSVPSTTSIVTDMVFISTTTSGDGKILRGDGAKWTLASTTTTTKYIFNGISKWVDFPSYDFTDLTLSALNDVLYCSLDQTKTFDLDINSRLWINMFKDTMDPAAFVADLTVTTDNGSYTITNPYITAASEAQKSQMMKIGPYDLTNTNSTVVVNSGSLPMFDSDTTNYTVSYTYGIVFTQTYSFNIVDYCSRFDKYNFLYLDRDGCFIPTTFNLLSKTSKTLKKTNYKKGYGSFNGTTWGYNTYDRGSKRLNTEIKEVINITSDWVNEYMSGFVEDMLESPEVYVVDPNGNWQAVNILDTNYTVKSRVNDKLINHTIKFEYAQGNGSQRG